MKSFCPSRIRMVLIFLTLLLVTQALWSQNTPDWIQGRADKNSIINAVAHGETKLDALAQALSLLAQKLDASIDSVMRDYTQDNDEYSPGIESSKTVVSIWFGDVKVKAVNKYFAEAADGDQPAAEYTLEMCHIALGDSLQSFTLKYLQELNQFVGDTDDQCYLEVAENNLKLRDLITALNTAGIQIKTFEDDIQYHVLLSYDVNNYEPREE